jgi:hypothetical protein
MAKFRDIRTLQRFTAFHASLNNHFHQDRHLNSRSIFKENARSLWPTGVSWRPEISGSGRSGAQFALD